MIGTTPSRVSHFTNKFRQLGFIDLQRYLGGPQLVIERRSARSTAYQKMNKSNFEQAVSVQGFIRYLWPSLRDLLGRKITPISEKIDGFGGPSLYGSKTDTIVVELPLLSGKATYSRGKEGDEQ
jgi:hypothetical protein